jgi:hypothetical protein
MVMNLLPCFAEFFEVRCELLFDAVQLAQCEAIVATEGDWAVGTAQIEQRFLPCSFDVNVCRAVVSGIDDYAEFANSHDGRHRRRIAYS